MLRRRAPVLLAVAALILLVSYIWHTANVMRELRDMSRRNTVTFARTFQAFNDTTPSAPIEALYDILELIKAAGVPVIITDSSGVPSSCVNLSFCDPFDAQKARKHADRLAREIPPVPIYGSQLAYFSDKELVRWLRIAPLVQASALVLLLATGFVLIRERMHSQRERLWAGMARESAHQIATPLTSLNGWIELFGDQDTDPVASNAILHMRADLQRLERVAHRFERIGRPARKDEVDLGRLVEDVANYFRARVPTLAHRVHISTEVPESNATVRGDAVLLEWALEALLKNAIDALAGREGHISVVVENVPEGGVRVRVADDGPGVSRELRPVIFDPGFTTKERGWGVGLALTRRIVQENHGGEVELLQSDRGALFEIRLP